MDPMKGSNIAAILADARASSRPSLRNPSRPFTPADSSRHLFVGQDYAGKSRPSSMYGANADSLLSGHPALTSQGSNRALLRRGGSGRSIGRPPMAPSALDLDASFLAQHAATLPSPLAQPHTPKGRDDGMFSSPNKARRHARSASPRRASPRSDGKEADDAGASVVVDEGVPTAAAALDGAALAASVLMQKLASAPDADVDGLERLAADAVGASAELASALSAAYTVTPVSQTGKDVMAKSLTNALTARRRLLRLAIRRMDKAAPGVLLRLGRVALTLAAAPGPLAASSGGRPPSASASKALQGALLHIARLLFVASKDKRNDDGFREHGVLTAILGTIQHVTPPAPAAGEGTDEGKDGAGAGIDPSLPVVDFVARSPEDLVYSVGVLKNVSNLADNQRWLVQQGAVQALVAVVRGCLRAAHARRRGSNGSGSADKSEDGSAPSVSSRQLAQLLVQVTGCLRNLALTKKHLKPFWLSAAVPALLALLGPFKLHSELMLNVARILSKMSLHEACRKYFTRDLNNLVRFTKLLSLHSRHALLLVRVLYVLGNVTSGNNLNRERLALDCNVVPPLLALLEHHGSQYVRLLAAEREASATAASASGDDGGCAEGKGGGEGGEAGAGAGGGAGAGSSGDGAAPSHKAARAQRREVEELLVKLVRVLANLAIHPDVGARLAVTPGMERLVDTLETADLEVAEELVLNLVSAITNLSFYNTPTDEPPVPFSGTGVELSSFAVTNIMHLHRLRITRMLVPLLFHDNQEAAVESARAFGNFSRDTEVRELMIQLRAVDALVLLLEHTNRELVFTSCGVLMNVVSDEAGKQLLRRGDLDGIGKLVELLHRCWEEDPDVGGLAAKTLYNFMLGWRGDGGGGMSQRPRFTAEQCVNLLEVLEDLIAADEESERSFDSSSGGKQAESPHQYIGVVKQLRTSVRELVQTGAVAMSSPSAGPRDRHSGPVGGDSDLVPLDAEGDDGY